MVTVLFYRNSTAHICLRDAKTEIRYRDESAKKALIKRVFASQSHCSTCILREHIRLVENGLLAHY